MRRCVSTGSNVARDTIVLHHDGAEATITLTADGGRVPVLETDFDAGDRIGLCHRVPLVEDTSCADDRGQGRRRPGRGCVALIVSAARRSVPA